MSIDKAAAASFLASHGRVLDRRRFALLVDSGDPNGVLMALDAYRNADGGYGWGIEPDLRSPESQPVGAMHALEVVAEVAPVTSAGSTRAGELCEWLDQHTLNDGGLPLTLPVTDPAGCASLWLNSDHEASSLQMTAQVAANAHRVARHDPHVARHRWLDRATTWCLEAIAGIDTTPSAHELLFAIRFLDAAAEAHPDALDHLERLGRLLPPDGVIHVMGGTPDEALRPHDLAPRPDGPARRLFAHGIVDAELDRLANRQQPDGGWTVDFESSSPTAALEWRGYATVAAVVALQSELRP